MKVSEALPAIVALPDRLEGLAKLIRTAEMAVPFALSALDGLARQRRRRRNRKIAMTVALGGAVALAGVVALAIRKRGMPSDLAADRPVVAA